jgi:hypothetical protein
MIRVDFIEDTPKRGEFHARNIRKITAVVVTRTRKYVTLRAELRSTRRNFSNEAVEMIRRHWSDYYAKARSRRELRSVWGNACFCFWSSDSSFSLAVLPGDESNWRSFLFAVLRDESSYARTRHGDRLPWETQAPARVQ